MIFFLILALVALFFAAMYFFAPQALIKADECLQRNLLEGKMTKWSFKHPRGMGGFLLVVAVILFSAWRMTK